MIDWPRPPPVAPPYVLSVFTLQSIDRVPGSKIYYSAQDLLSIASSCPYRRSGRLVALLTTLLMITNVSNLVGFFRAAERRLPYRTKTESLLLQIESMRSQKSRVKSRKGIGTYHHQSQDTVVEPAMNTYRVPR